MKVSKLVKMANQIALNCDYGVRDKAVAATADHMSRFWTPDMLAAIIEHAKGSGAGDLGAVAAGAVAEIERSRSNAA